MILENTIKQASQLLKNHNIRKVDNIVTEASQKVKEGEVYSVSIPNTRPTSYKPENIPLDIKYEDENIIIVNKILK